MSTASTPFQTVAQIGEIPAGEGRAYLVDGTLVAVFFVGKEYHAIQDACPHMGASLASGYVEGGSVTCPWHAWRFCIREGSWLDAPRSPVKAEVYEVRLQGNEIQVRRKAGPEVREPGLEGPGCGSDRANAASR